MMRPVRFPKLTLRGVLKTLAIILLLVLLLPPLQVLLAVWWQPPIIPMHLQRTWQAHREARGEAATAQIWVPLRQIPPEFMHFVWASEDQNFFQHRGFDFEQMNHAIKEAKAHNKPVRGSSTITMQCARTVFLWQGRSYIRKGLEAYYTLWMELLMSKRRILELYLNNIELGPGVYGLGAAAKFYFQRPPAELTRGQMIALAAILPNPLQWSPVHPDATVEKKIRRIERLASRARFPQEKLSGK